VLVTPVSSGAFRQLDLVDGANLTKLNRPAFPKSREEKELEAERVRELIDRGILVPSKSPHPTKYILAGKKRNVNGSAGGMRVTSDFRALNAVTENIAYLTKDVKTIVGGWQQSKSTLSLICGTSSKREYAEEGSSLNDGEEGFGST
jgi:hypothetical protein